MLVLGLLTDHMVVSARAEEVLTHGMSGTDSAAIGPDGMVVAEVDPRRTGLDDPTRRGDGLLLINAAAVAAVRAGFRVALSVASVPAAPPSRLAGIPTIAARVVTSTGAKPATPSSPSNVPPASANNDLPEPRWPPSVA